MPPQYTRFATLLPYLQQVADPPVSGNPPVTPPAADPPKPDDNEPLGEAGKAALTAEREARRLADQRAKDAEKKLADLDAAAKAEAEAKAKQQGEWQKLAEEREASLTETTTSLEAATTELTTLRAYVNSDIKAAIKDLPKALVAFDPGEDAPLAQRLDWLTKAKANAAEITASGTPGNGPNPKPAGSVKPEIPSALPKQRLFS